MVDTHWEDASSCYEPSWTDDLHQASWPLTSSSSSSSPPSPPQSTGAAVSNFYWTNQKQSWVSCAHPIAEGIAAIVGHRRGVVDALIAEMLQTGGHQEQLHFAVKVYLCVLTGHQDKLFPWKRHSLHSPQDLRADFLFQVEILPLVHHFIVIFVNGVIQVSYGPRGTGRTR